MCNVCVKNKIFLSNMYFFQEVTIFPCPTFLEHDFSLAVNFIIIEQGGQPFI